jgi:hypothetical protein
MMRIPCIDSVGAGGVVPRKPEGWSAGAPWHAAEKVADEAETFTVYSLDHVHGVLTTIFDGVGLVLGEEVWMRETGARFSLSFKVVIICNRYGVQRSDSETALLCAALVALSGSRPYLILPAVGQG